MFQEWQNQLRRHRRQKKNHDPGYDDTWRNSPKYLTKRFAQNIQWVTWRIRAQKKRIRYRKSSRTSATHFSNAELSEHDAVLRLVGIPLKRTNTAVQFIPTGYKGTRTRMLKSMNVINRMEDDDESVFQSNILDKYAARPNDLDNLCLAEFVSQYSINHSSRTADEETSETEYCTNQRMRKMMTGQLRRINARHWL